MGAQHTKNWTAGEKCVYTENNISYRARVIGMEKGGYNLIVDKLGKRYFVDAREIKPISTDTPVNIPPPLPLTRQVAAAVDTDIPIPGPNIMDPLAEESDDDGKEDNVGLPPLADPVPVPGQVDGNGVQVYDPAQLTSVELNTDIDADIAQAVRDSVEAHELELQYQQTLRNSLIN